MDRKLWQNLFKKRFVLNPPGEYSLPGETTYSLKEKQIVIIINSATPAGVLKAESLTDTDECLVINRGQGKCTYVDWDKVEAITAVDY